MKLFIELTGKKCLDKGFMGEWGLMIINKKSIIKVEASESDIYYFITLSNNETYLCENENNKINGLREELKHIEV